MENCQDLQKIGKRGQETRLKEGRWITAMEGTREIMKYKFIDLYVYVGVFPLMTRKQKDEIYKRIIDDQLELDD